MRLIFINFLFLSYFNLNISMSIFSYLDQDISIYSQDNEDEIALIENLDLSILDRNAGYNTLKNLLNKEIERFILNYYQEMTDYYLIKHLIKEIYIEIIKNKDLKLLIKRYIRKKFTKILDKNELNINCINEKGNTLLMSFVKNRKFKLVKLILEIKNIDINFENFSGDTALSISILNNDKKLTKLLLKNCKKEKKLVNKKDGINHENSCENFKLKKTSSKKVIMRLKSWSFRGSKNI